LLALQPEYALLEHLDFLTQDKAGKGGFDPELFIDPRDLGDPRHLGDPRVIGPDGDSDYEESDEERDEESGEEREEGKEEGRKDGREGRSHVSNILLASLIHSPTPDSPGALSHLLPPSIP